MVRKTRAKKTFASSSSDFQSDRIRSNQEAYEKLSMFRPIWAERKVILDEVDPEI